MSLTAVRQSRGLSLEQFAVELGLQANSKGYLSRLESGSVPFPIRLALQIESWSGGELLAIDLLEPDGAKLLRQAFDRAVERARARA